MLSVPYALSPEITEITFSKGITILGINVLKSSGERVIEMESSKVKLLSKIE